MNKEQIKEQLCYSCYAELELIIETKEVLKAKLTKMTEGEIIPTFDIEFDDNSEIEYNTYWVCPTCKIRAYDANKELTYDEVNDVLIYPAYDPDEKLGYKGPIYQPPFSPNVSSIDKSFQTKKEKLPTIVKASVGEIIKTEVADSLMEGYGWD